jgi:hypothetical protein
MTRNALIVLSLGLALGALGCSKRSVQLSSEQKQIIKTQVGKDATKPTHPLDLKFGDAITLIGYDIDTPTLTPGREALVTWHFRVHKQLEEGTHVFVHLADGNEVNRKNLDQDSKLRGFYPAQEWPAGSYVRDPQVIALPDDWTSDRAIVYLGFWRDNPQLADEEKRMPVVGPSDGHRRGRALVLPVNASAKPIEVPELAVKRAEGAIKLDGKLDEPAWSKAISSGALVNTLTGEAAEPSASVKLLWDDKNVYFAFDVADEYLKSTFTKNDDHLWEQDCVEIMVDPDGDGKNYFELQVSPANKHFDTSYDSRRVPQPFGHVDYDSKLSSGVSAHGKLNDDDKDEGYIAEIAVPWSAFTVGEAKQQAPKPGDTFRMNFYVMDARKEGVRAVGWSPPRVGDFHVPARFGKITFE